MAEGARCALPLFYSTDPGVHHDDGADRRPITFRQTEKSSQVESEDRSQSGFGSVLEVAGSFEARHCFENASARFPLNFASVKENCESSNPSAQEGIYLNRQYSWRPMFN